MADPAPSVQNEPPKPLVLEAKPPAPRKLLPSRFKQAELVRNVWAIVPPAGTAFEEVLDRKYWSHVSTSLKPSDRVEVLAEDGSYFAELIVRATGPQWADVSVLRKCDLDAVSLADDSAVSVEWRGPHHRFCVVRTSDKQIIKGGFAEKADANKHAANIAGGVTGAAA